MQVPGVQDTELTDDGQVPNGWGACPAQVMVWVSTGAPPSGRITVKTKVASRLPAPSRSTSDTFSFATVP